MIEMKHITKTYGDLTVFLISLWKFQKGRFFVSWENPAEVRPLCCGCLWDWNSRMQAASLVWKEKDQCCFSGG